MKQTLQALLWRTTSPKFYAKARFRWWMLSYAGPKQLTGGSVPPRLQAFPQQNNELYDRLSKANTAIPTGLCRIMTRNGSDKGAGWHNYTTVYASLFAGLQERPLRVFELGLGTNNPELLSTMGYTGSPGASLRGWREFFPKASIFGADIDRAILFESDRIKTFYCDQLDAVAIHELWQQPDLRDEMDILIEDGLHTFEGNVSFLNGSLSRIRKGGYYIIEDVEGHTLDRWKSLLETYPARFPDYEFVIAELPNPMNDRDNNLIMIRRKQ